MSLPGPIFGRAQGRRNNRSLIGVTTPHTNSTDVFEGNYNPYGASGAYDGKAQIGITTLTQHHSDSMRAKWRVLTSYCDTAGPTGSWGNSEHTWGRNSWSLPKVPYQMSLDNIQFQEHQQEHTHNQDGLQFIIKEV